MFIPFLSKDVCTPDEVIKVNYTIKRIGLDNDRLNNSRAIQIEETFKLFNDDAGNLLPLIERQKIIASKLKENDFGQLTPYFSTIKDTFSFSLKVST